MKNIVVTGVTSGIGREVARQLLKLGHNVIANARAMEKAEKVKSELIKDTGNDNFVIMEADFADFKSVIRFADSIKQKYLSLDILINNAGTWEMEFKETLNGIETNLQVNHLSPMLLTLELLPMLMKPDAARIINTSSGAHRRDILNTEDLEFRNIRYDGVSSYSQSKLLNILFSLELSNKLKNSSVTVNTVHPGYVRTSLFDKMGARNWTGVPEASLGAQSALYAALSPDLECVSGKYFYLNKEDSNLSEKAKSRILASQVWDLSLQYLKNYTVNLNALSGNYTHKYRNVSGV